MNDILPSLIKDRFRMNVSYSGPILNLEAYFGNKLADVISAVLENRSYNSDQILTLTDNSSATCRHDGILYLVLLQ